MCVRCVHDDKPPLELDATYWALRDSVVQCELLIVRVLRFNVTFDHPHKVRGVSLSVC
jgi:hypothetical protein